MNPLKVIQTQTQSNHLLQKQTSNKSPLFLYNQFLPKIKHKMHLNKMQLQSRIEINEQLTLKCMEFATQFMLKKAEYRLLNPLHFQHSKKDQVLADSQLMADLATYADKDKNQPLKIKKSRINNSIIIKNTDSISKDQKTPSSPNKQSLPNHANSKEKSGLLSINQVQLKSKIPPIIPQQQTSPSLSNKPPIKPTASYFIDDDSLILKQQSNIKLSAPPKHNKLDFSSSDQDAKSIASSQKNKSKFQKLPNYSRKPNQKDQALPNQSLNFKRKPPMQQKSLTESPIIKKTQSDNGSDKQSDNYPLARSNNNKKDEVNQRTSFDSYHSSILSDAKKIQIHVVSEHASENDISVISQKRRKEDFTKGELAKTSVNKGRQEGQRVGLKKTFSHNEEPSSGQVYKIAQQRSQRLSGKDPDIIIGNQNPLQQAFVPDLPHEQTPQQQTPSPEQISNFIMKMESFEVQQQMLLKKLTKVWSKQSKCIKAIKQIKWQDLQLPKPTFIIQTHQYAQIIE